MTNKDIDLFPDGHGVVHMEGVECKFSNLLNYYTVGACFFHEKIKINSPEAFSFICFITVIVSAVMEATRRGAEELDRYLLNHHARTSERLAARAARAERWEPRWEEWRQRKKTRVLAKEQVEKTVKSSKEKVKKTAKSLVAKITGGQTGTDAPAAEGNNTTDGSTSPEGQPEAGNAPASDASPDAEGYATANGSPAAVDAAANPSPALDEPGLAEPDAIALAPLSRRPSEDPDAIMPTSPLPQRSVPDDPDAIMPAPLPQSSASEDPDAITPAPPLGQATETMRGRYCDFVLSSAPHVRFAADPVTTEIEPEKEPSVEEFARFRNYLPPEVKRFRVPFSYQITRALLRGFQCTCGLMLLLLGKQTLCHDLLRL